MSKPPVDPTKFGYRLDQDVVLTGREFVMLQHLAQQAIGNGVTESFVQVSEWIDVETSKEVEKPTQEQIEQGKVRLMPSKDKTLRNRQVSYASNLFPHVFDGNEAIFQAHMRNIENGTAVPVEVLQKEAQEAQAAQEKKGTMSVVKEEVEVE